MNEIEQLKREIADLKKWKASLERSSTIPLNINQSFKARLVFAELFASDKTAASETQAVDEGGTDTYNVMKSPDDFLQAKVDGSTYYIPVFTELT